MFSGGFVVSSYSALCFKNLWKRDVDLERVVFLWEFSGHFPSLPHSLIVCGSYGSRGKKERSVFIESWGQLYLRSSPLTGWIGKGGEDSSNPLLPPSYKKHDIGS